MTLPLRRSVVEAVLCGVCWGLCTPAPSWTGLPLVLLTAARIPRWSRSRSHGALLGAIWGVCWFAVALSWFPRAWQDFTASSPLLPTAALVAVLAAPVALAGFLGGRGHWWGWAVGMALHEALAAFLPLPAATTLVMAESGRWLAPASLWRPLLPLVVFAIGGAWANRRDNLARLTALGWLLSAMAWPLWLPKMAGETVVALVQPDVGVLEGRTGSTREARAEAVLALLDGVEAHWVALPEDGWPLDPGDGPGVRQRALLEAWQGRPPALLGTTASTDTGIVNRLLVVEDGAVGEHFDKHLLVPAFERRWLGLGRDTYQPGFGARVLPVAGLRVGPLICYEDLWAEAAREARRHGAQVLLAATNDGWLGPRGARQHLAFARLAAVSAGLWVLRPTLSGSTAVIDAHGRVHEQTAWVDGDDPAHLGQVLTVRVPLAR